jgi:hypothetical protein
MGDETLWAMHSLHCALCSVVWRSAWHQDTASSAISESQTASRREIASGVPGRQLKDRNSKTANSITATQ